MGESRHYRILGVLGSGGFGKVYRARLEGPQGFKKEVALKLLHEDAELPAGTLERFRDEARVLGLVRDRAVVGVDPPLRLEGRWAVVMEYVEGRSCRELLRDRGPMPPRIALSIVGEVARALAHLYDHPGPEGKPLRLLHRDIKPANVQVDRTGAVKLLDFGIARADFAERETNTTAAIAGTYGYIAPERLAGQEGPAADVYSLGVMLRSLVTGRKPRRKLSLAPQGDFTGDKEDLGFVAARDLVSQMTEPDPDKRPSAHEVDRRCRQLLSELPGIDLRTWAEEYASPTEQTEDHLVGQVLSHTLTQPTLMHTDATMETGQTRSVIAVTTLFGGLGVLGGAFGVFALLLAAAVGWQLSQADFGTVDAPPTAADGVVEAEPDPEPEVAPEPEPEPEVAPEPEPEPVVAPAPAPAPKARPRRTQPAPAPAPVKALPTHKVTFGSSPMGAEVFVGGQSLGFTPLAGRTLAEGRHEVTMKLGDDSITRSIELGDRLPTRFVWKGGDRWEAQL